ncbi:hypothetical protein ACHAQA_005548 [Verticillium albo-atrum]
MLHNTTKLALLALLGAAVAEDVVVTVIMPLFYQPGYIGASVIDVSEDATTFALGCQSQVPKTECAITEAVTLVAGPSTMAMTAVLAYESTEIPITMTAECEIDVAANEATCTQYQTLATESSVETTVIPDIASFSSPLTITAGTEKLTDVPGAEASATASGSAAETSSTPTGSASESAATEDSASTAGGEATTTTDDGNAALPRMTQNAVLAGVAAVVGGAMML